MNRREFILGAVGGAGALVAGCAGARVGETEPSGARQFTCGRGSAVIRHPMVKEPLSFTVIADTHLALIDDRDAAWRDHAKRMMQWPGREEDLDAAFAAARKHGAELVALAGDMFSFPSLANIDFLSRRMAGSGLDCRYIAGNHDWHFEGTPGTDDEQRAEWIAKRMSGLYRGEDPSGYSVMKRGVRFVFLDNTTYLISPRQLAFVRQELAKGDPTVFVMHVPFYMNPQSAIDTLAHPRWGAATDVNWKAERRLRWREDGQSAESFALRELVFSSPNTVAVFAGHEHDLQVGCERGVPQIVVPKNQGSGLFMNVRLEEAIQ